MCLGGVRSENSCADGLDNDGDGKIDCQEPSCNAQNCAGTGGGCTCTGLLAVETICLDDLDNDLDGATDCADTNCTTCGTNCACIGGVATESGTTACRDAIDNNLDGLTDCADANCVGQRCSNTVTTAVCTAGGACQ